MSDYSSNPVLFWHRRDLRVCDNQGLYTALKSGRPVIPIFIFDRNILDDLEDRDDARVTFIHDHVVGLNELYAAHGATLRVEYGNPEELIPSLAQEYGASAVYTNRDYEPYAVARDAQAFPEVLLRAGHESPDDPAALRDPEVSVAPVGRRHPWGRRVGQA